MADLCRKNKYIIYHTKEFKWKLPGWRRAPRRERQTRLPDRVPKRAVGNLGMFSCQAHQSLYTTTVAAVLVPSEGGYRSLPCARDVQTSFLSIDGLHVVKLDPYSVVAHRHHYPRSQVNICRRQKPCLADPFKTQIPCPRQPHLPSHVHTDPGFEYHNS